MGWAGVYWGGGGRRGPVGGGGGGVRAGWTERDSTASRHKGYGSARTEPY